jgi:hypothetical protein
MGTQTQTMLTTFYLDFKKVQTFAVFQSHCSCFYCRYQSLPFGLKRRVLIHHKLLNGFTCQLVLQQQSKMTKSEHHSNIVLSNQELHDLQRGVRWPRGQCARRAIAEPKQCSQKPVIGSLTKIYYLELLRVSEGTLSSWSRLHLQSLTPALVSRRVDVRQAAGCKNNC